MRPDITNAIAALLLVRISVKRRVSALIPQVSTLLFEHCGTACASLTTVRDAQTKPAGAAQAPYSFSVNFQPV